MYRQWAPYVPVAQRRRQAAAEMDQLKRKGHPVSPVVIEGRAITTTAWGKAWCANLEAYGDYANRLPRGRTYVRNGSVVDLQIAAGRVEAQVSGSSLYRVTVTITPLPASRWRALCADCAGGIDSLVELLQGRLAKGVMERLCRPRDGLFPAPAEIKLACSCPDGAMMCKHVAAVLYGVGARLDLRPELLFTLRQVDAGELLANAGQGMAAAPAGDGLALADDDLSALFGLDLDVGAAPVAAASTAGRGTKAAPTAAGSKGAAMGTKAAPVAPAAGSKGGPRGTKSGPAAAAGSKGAAVAAAAGSKGAAGRVTKAAPVAPAVGSKGAAVAPAAASTGAAAPAKPATSAVGWNPRPKAAEVEAAAARVEVGLIKLMLQRGSVSLAEAEAALGVGVGAALQELVGARRVVEVGATGGTRFKLG